MTALTRVQLVLTSAAGLTFWTAAQDGSRLAWFLATWIIGNILLMSWKLP